MKLFIAGLASFFALLNGNAYDANAANMNLYRCDCYDTGLECEGGEVMFLKVSGKSVSFKMASSDGKLYSRQQTFNFGEGTFNPRYRPRSNIDYFKYDLKDRKTYPFLLVEKSLVSGAASGYVKKPEMTREGSHGHTWEFECKRENY